MEEKALLEGSLSGKLMEDFMDTVREEVIAIAKTQPQKGQAKDTFTKSQVSTLGVGIFTKRIQRDLEKNFKNNYKSCPARIKYVDRGSRIANVQPARILDG